MITDETFIAMCKGEVRKYAQHHLDKSDNPVEFDVYVVWACKTLQNWKALLSTTLTDGMYYELTLDGDNHSLYFDAYKKWDNYPIDISHLYNSNNN